MKVPIRSSITGTEYWDTEKKLTIFVPRGQEPDFEVTKNPNSMITAEGDKKPEFLTKQLNAPELNNQEVLDSDGNTKDDLNSDTVTNPEEKESSELEGMTAKELRAYAKKNNIEIPAAIRAKGDILEIIKEAEK